MNLSVVVPVLKHDEPWLNLLADLKSLSAGDEVILVSPAAKPIRLNESVKEFKILASVFWEQTAKGRAAQMNQGAGLAKNEFLWFLHSDTRLSKESVKKVKLALKTNSKSLLFFNLKFLQDGPTLMTINQIGVFFRSRILRIPFGDQGFCLSKSIFVQLGRFDETAPFGEDHLLVWRAHQKKVPLYCVGSGLFTSARRYSEHGWVHTTSKYLYLTAKQAGPQVAKLIRSRVSQ